MPWKTSSIESDLRTQIETVIGVAQADLESHWSQIKNPDAEEQQTRNDLEAGIDWLEDNLDHIIADAEFDGRAVGAKAGD